MRVLRAIIVSMLVFITYIVYTGSITIYDLITGTIVAVATGYLFSNITISDPIKVLNPVRWLYLIKYALRYFIIDETLAHVDVIRRIIHPRTPVNPAIVKVPYYVTSDYAKTAIACSITNTPGTVVVEIDDENKVFYVHWIDAKTLDPGQARLSISRVFEDYSKKIFD